MNKSGFKNVIYGKVGEIYEWELKKNVGHDHKHKYSKSNELNQNETFIKTSES